VTCRIAGQQHVIAGQRGDALHEQAVTVARIARDDHAPGLRRDAQEQELVAVMERRLHAVSGDTHASQH